MGYGWKNVVRWISCLMLLGLLSGLSALGAEDAVSRGDAKTQPDGNDGTWVPQSALLAGTPFRPDDLKKITLKIAGGFYEVHIEGLPQVDKGTCELDPTSNPKRMTIKGTEGPNKGKTILAIYERKGADTLRVCYDLSGQEFPRAFESPQGTLHYLVEYRRVK